MREGSLASLSAAGMGGDVLVQLLGELVILVTLVIFGGRTSCNVVIRVFHRPTFLEKK